MEVRQIGSNMSEVLNGKGARVVSTAELRELIR